MSNEISEKIDAYIGDLPGWQAHNLKHFRKLLHEVEPDIKEDWKWAVPVFLVGKKLVCAMSPFSGHTKFNFFEGAELVDTHDLFNSGLDSKKHRSINLAEGDKIQDSQLKDLINEAVTYAQLG